MFQEMKKFKSKESIEDQIASMLDQVMDDPEEGFVEIQELDDSNASFLEEEEQAEELRVKKKSITMKSRPRFGKNNGHCSNSGEMNNFLDENDHRSGKIKFNTNHKNKNEIGLTNMNSGYNFKMPNKLQNNFMMSSPIQGMANNFQNFSGVPKFATQNSQRLSQNSGLFLNKIPKQRSFMPQNHNIHNQNMFINNQNKLSFSPSYSQLSNNLNNNFVNHRRGSHNVQTGPSLGINEQGAIMNNNTPMHNINYQPYPTNNMVLRRHSNFVSTQNISNINNINYFLMNNCNNVCPTNHSSPGINNQILNYNNLKNLSESGPNIFFEDSNSTEGHSYEMNHNSGMGNSMNINNSFNFGNQMMTNNLTHQQDSQNYFNIVNNNLNDSTYNEIEKYLVAIDKIDDYIYNKYKGKFLLIIKTQNGSKVFQKYLKNTNQIIVTNIFYEIKEKLHVLISDPCSNFFIQRIFGFLEANDRICFLKQVKYYFNSKFKH